MRTPFPPFPLHRLATKPSANNSKSISVAFVPELEITVPDFGSDIAKAIAFAKSNAKANKARGVVSVGGKEKAAFDFTKH